MNARRLALAAVSPEGDAVCGAPDGTHLPPVYTVPERWRRNPDAEEFTDHGIRYYSLGALFPEAPGLADAYDEDASFRWRLRWATREDLFDPIARFSAKANAKIKAMDGTLLCCLRQPEQRDVPRPCPELTALFHEMGWSSLHGSEFMERLFSLCGEVSYNVQDRTHPSGSFSDIVAPGGGEHRWHQDHGWDKLTVLMGFPAEDRWCGEGAFSHVARLSHPLPVPDRPVPVVFGESAAVGERLPEECVWRPLYAKGAEILVYCDSSTMHSAPDRTNREALWRLQ